jgi:hypothetical protein
MGAYVPLVLEKKISNVTHFMFAVHTQKLNGSPFYQHTKKK